MSDVIKKRASESMGKEIKVFLINNFRYVGKLTNCDDSWLEVLDYRTNSYKLIRFEEIKDLEVKQ